MKSMLLFVSLLAALVTCNGNRVIKNFIVFLNVDNFKTANETTLLSNIIASPILKTTPRILPESDVLLNYSIKFPYIEDAISISSSDKYTIEYFQYVIRENSLDIKVFPIMELHSLVQDSPPFTEILMITDIEPESSNDFLPNVLDLMNKKMIKVVVNTLDNLMNSFETNSYLYNSMQMTNISNKYRRINKLTKVMRSEMFFTKILKRMLTKDENMPTRNSTITIINGIAFYNYLQVWDFALHVGVFLSEFNRTQLFSYNGQVMWINDFLVTYAFENDYVVKIDLTAEYIPGTYIDVLTDHCKNENFRRKMNFAMKKHMKHHSKEPKIYEEFWRKESSKIKFPLTSLVKALIDSLPRSVIYVLTDVPPENIELMPSILKLMEEKNITVDFSYYGERTDIDPDPEEYVQINKASIMAL